MSAEMLTPDRMIRHWREVLPDAPAVIDARGAWSWRALDEAVQALVPQLEPLAEGGGVLVLPQDGGAVALLAAAAAVRFDPVVVSALHGERSLAASLSARPPRRVLGIAGGRLRILDENPAAAAAGAGDGLSLLTSGSTGHPKCARHTWASIARLVKPAPHLVGVRWLAGFPLSHYAAVQVLLQSLLAGSCLVVPDRFEPAALLEALRAHEVDHLNTTPSLMRQLLLASGPGEWRRMKLRRVMLGGEIVDQGLLDAIADHRRDLRVVHVYGSTEAGALITVRDGRAGFDARLLDGERLRIVDGELHARRSPAAMAGYVGQAPPGEWIATGDLVAVEGDRARFLGRRDEVINVGGFKVSPAQVEGVVRGVPGVREALVVGHRSSIVGQIVKAVVCAEPDADPAALRAEVQARCAALLPAPMVPRLVEFRSSLERTVTQKLARSAER